MRKQCKRRPVARGVVPIVFKHCAPATSKLDEWKSRIVGMYLAMVDHKFTDDDFAYMHEFVVMCRVICSVAKMDDFDDYVSDTVRLMFSPYNRKQLSGKWIFTSDESDRLRARLNALAEAVAALPLLTIHFAMKDVKKQKARLMEAFKRDAENYAKHVAG